MRNLKLTIEYKGTNYAGFQRQPDQLTIQEVLEKILSRILQEEVALTGAGRTDAGVHAKGQVVNFPSKSVMECGRMKWSANSLLPVDIVIREAVEVGESFHARYDAISREYRYIILNRDFPSPFWHDFAYYFRHLLDLNAIQEAGITLEGKHDFSSFCVAESKPDECVRELEKLDVTRENDLIYLDIKANAFLHNMVRVIAGTLLQVGTGELKPEQVRSILKAKDRTKAGPTAPAKGLFLMKVNYLERRETGDEGRIKAY